MTLLFLPNRPSLSTFVFSECVAHVCVRAFVSRANVHICVLKLCLFVCMHVTRRALMPCRHVLQRPSRGRSRSCSSNTGSFPPFQQQLRPTVREPFSSASDIHVIRFHAFEHQASFIACHDPCAPSRVQWLKSARHPLSSTYLAGTPARQDNVQGLDDQNDCAMSTLECSDEEGGSSRDAKVASQTLPCPFPCRSICVICDHVRAAPFRRHQLLQQRENSYSMWELLITVPATSFPLTRYHRAHHGARNAQTCTRKGGSQKPQKSTRGREGGRIVMPEKVEKIIRCRVRAADCKEESASWLVRVLYPPTPRQTREVSAVPSSEGRGAVEEWD